MSKTLREMNDKAHEKFEADSIKYGEHLAEMGQMTMAILGETPSPNSLDRLFAASPCGKFPIMGDDSDCGLTHGHAGNCVPKTHVLSTRERRAVALLREFLCDGVMVDGFRVCPECWEPLGRCRSDCELAAVLSLYGDVS